MKGLLTSCALAVLLCSGLAASRELLQDMAVSATATAAATATGSGSATAGSNAIVQNGPAPTAAPANFTLPPLGYGYDALEPFIDNMTMFLHHTRHHQAAITGLNTALATYPDLRAIGLVELNRAVGTARLPAVIATAVRNNAGGHWNHKFFWTILAPAAASGAPAGALLDAINRDFGSVEAMRAAFNTTSANRFGSGWGWVIVQPDGKLNVTSTPNQDNPLQAAVAPLAGIPILGIDVWEHAHYLKYFNNRAAYITAFWNVINWPVVGQYYQEAVAGRVVA